MITMFVLLTAECVCVPLSHLTPLWPVSPASSDRHQYEQALALAGRYLDGPQLGLLRLSLSLRRHSPRVALWQRLAEQRGPPADCAAFVQLGGRLLCSADELAGAAAEAEAAGRPETFPVDHHYRDEAAPTTGVLYGRLGTRPLCQLHAELRRLADQKRIDYVLRPCSKVRPTTDRNWSRFSNRHHH